MHDLCQTRTEIVTILTYYNYFTNHYVLQTHQLKSWHVAALHEGDPENKKQKQSDDHPSKNITKIQVLPKEKNTLSLTSIRF